MRLRFRRTLEFTLTVLLVCFTPVAVLLPGILHGDVALSTDSVFAFTPWEEARQPETAPPSNPEANLMAQQYFPWYVFLSEAGEIRDVLWNPLENAGLPFLALWRTRCLSPFTLPFYLGEPGLALTWSVYLKLLVAGLCAMYAARRLGFHRPVALFVALAFQLSAGMVLWWGYPITDVLPWLPLLVLYCERIALGHYRMWVSGAVVMGLMLLGGDPQGVAVLMVFAALFLLTRSKLDGRGLKGAALPLLVLAASGLLSLCLAAVQLLPFAEFMREARTLGLVPPDSTISIWDLSLIVLPHLHGAFTQALRSGDASAQTAGLLHVGIAQIALLPVWLAMRPFSNVRQRHRIEALLLPSLLLTILAFLWGPVLRLIPVIDLIAPHHYLAANGFVLALAAAATAEEWVHLNAQDCQDTLKRLLIFGPMFLLFAAGVVALGVMSPETTENVKTLAI
ncbi:MAG: hypothetical protein IT364_16860, partial [Candidatus Hydrogenedentes bacterium]|nr:hypothetical protein [Candidatus Hydrogenedentota bacterium]